jgi:hypothetical protein
LALALALRNLPTEAAEEFLERIDLALYRHPLLGGDIDHRRRQSRREIRK